MVYIKLILIVSQQVEVVPLQVVFVHDSVQASRWELSVVLVMRIVEELLCLLVVILTDRVLLMINRMEGSFV